jgi:hypothetical protein
MKLQRASLYHNVKCFLSTLENAKPGHSHIHILTGILSLFKTYMNDLTSFISSTSDITSNFKYLFLLGWKFINFSEPRFH